MERYERQLIMEGWGADGQKRLSRARVGVVGAGGLGSPVTSYLAAAGIGRLTICDYQEVELSNLNRQILYGTADIGNEKASAAARRLGDLNPDIVVDARASRIDEDNITEIFSDHDMVIDCLDNLETRFVLNRFCVDAGIPFLHAGVQEFYGQLMLIDPPRTACLACFLQAAEAPDGPLPICGATAGVLGSLQAAMALRHLLGVEPRNAGSLFIVDLTEMKTERVEMAKRPDCPVCGRGSGG